MGRITKVLAAFNTQSMDVDEDASQHLDMSPHWIRQYGLLKEAFAHIASCNGESLRYLSSIGASIRLNKAYVT